MFRDLSMYWGIRPKRRQTVPPCLDDQLCRLSPCRQSTADIIGEVFRRQTGDLNKYCCIQPSCGGGESRVQRKQISCMCWAAAALSYQRWSGAVADWPFHQKTVTLSSQIGSCPNLAA